MVEIKAGQELEVHNLLSYRGKVTQVELEKIGRDMEQSLSLIGAKCIGNPILATYGVDKEKIDVEILLPVDRAVSDMGNYKYKNTLKIVNAVVASYTGNPVGLQGACDELNKYILNNNMQPITIGYNVTKHMDAINVENTQIDVYVGISPNIL